MRDGRRARLLLLGMALGCGARAAGTPPAVPPPPGPPPDDNLLALLEYLGEEEIAGDAWTGFLDSLPEPLEDADPPDPVPVAAPIAAGEDLP